MEREVARRMRGMSRQQREAQGLDREDLAALEEEDEIPPPPGDIADEVDEEFSFANPKAMGTNFDDIKGVLKDVNCKRSMDIYIYIHVYIYMYMHLCAAQHIWIFVLLFLRDICFYFFLSESQHQARRDAGQAPGAWRWALRRWSPQRLQGCCGTPLPVRSCGSFIIIIIIIIIVIIVIIITIV